MKDTVFTLTDHAVGIGFLIVFGTLLIIIIMLLTFNWQVSSNLEEERKATWAVLKQNNDITNTATTLQRALDRAEGKLSVYESYLAGTQASTVNSLVRKYLEQEKAKPENVTLAKFYKWLSEQFPNSGIGGPYLQRAKP